MPISENATVITVKALVDNLTANFVEKLFLRRFFVSDVVESEGVFHTFKAQVLLVTDFFYASAVAEHVAAVQVCRWVGLLAFYICFGV